MTRKLLLAAAAGLSALTLSAAAPTPAEAGVRFSVHIGSPYYGGHYGYYRPRPVYYYRPAPVYYYRPAPVYYGGYHHARRVCWTSHRRVWTHRWGWVLKPVRRCAWR